MKSRLLMLLALVAGSMLTSKPLSAHHGAAGYDMENLTIKKVTITDFEWTNPHCQISFDSPGNGGDVDHWVIEAPPPPILVDRGWTRKSLKPGDSVIMQFHAAKNGAKAGIMLKAIFPDGHVISAYNDPPQTSSAK